MMDDGGGGGGGGPMGPDTILRYSDPMANLNPERATPRDFDERDQDEKKSRGSGSRANLRIPRYGPGAGTNSEQS